MTEPDNLTLLTPFVITSASKQTGLVFIDVPSENELFIELSHTGPESRKETKRRDI